MIAMIISNFNLKINLLHLTVYTKDQSKTSKPWAIVGCWVKSISDITKNYIEARNNKNFEINITEINIYFALPFWAIPDHPFETQFDELW